MLRVWGVRDAGGEATVVADSEEEAVTRKSELLAPCRPPGKPKGVAEEAGHCQYICTPRHQSWDEQWAPRHTGVTLMFLPYQVKALFLQAGCHDCTVSISAPPDLSPKMGPRDSQMWWVHGCCFTGSISEGWFTWGWVAARQEGQLVTLGD